MGPHPSERDILLHLRGADGNLDFGDWLKSSSGRTDALTIGWAITTLFYPALHELRAYLLARHGKVVDTHEEMKHLPRQYSELKRTHPDYEFLKQESQTARYYLNKNFTWADFEKLRRACMTIRSRFRPLTEVELKNPRAPTKP